MPLLQAALAMWQIDASARRSGSHPHVVEIASARCRLHIEPAPGHGWQASGDGGSVVLPALPAVLAHLRTCLDANYSPGKPIIGIAPSFDD